MSISDPDHWIEAYKHKAAKYDKIVEMIAAINANSAKELNDLDDVNAPSPSDGDIIYWNDSASEWQTYNLYKASYIHIISASLVATASSGSSNELSGTNHRTTATGSPALYFEIPIPEFLAKFADEESKTLQVTNVGIMWSDLDSTDYIDRIRIWWKEYDQSVGASILDDGTNRGSGTTHTVPTEITCNVTDRTMVKGDWLLIIIDLSQATAQSQRFYSFKVTFTLS